MVKQSLAKSLPIIKTAGHPSLTHFRLSTLFPILLVILVRQYMFEQWQYFPLNEAMKTQQNSGWTSAREISRMRYQCFVMCRQEVSYFSPRILHISLKTYRIRAQQQSNPNETHDAAGFVISLLGQKLFLRNQPFLDN